MRITVRFESADSYKLFENEFYEDCCDLMMFNEICWMVYSKDLSADIIEVLKNDFVEFFTSAGIDDYIISSIN